MSPLKNRKILITAGGTGGHVFPAINYGLELEAKGAKVYFITDHRGLRVLKKAYPKTRPLYKIISLGVPYTSFHRIAYYLSLAGSLLWATVKAIYHIRKIRPDVIVGFGGYVSFPILSVGKTLRLPFFLHEQNAVAGQVNRMFAKHAEVVALTFPQTERLPDMEKTVLVKMPMVNPYTQKPRPKRGGTKFTLAIFGGSQGSHYISEISLKGIALLSPDLQARLHVDHQCRESDKVQCQEFYARHGISATITPFFQFPHQVYHQADLAVCRAGAGTLCELAEHKLPAIVIPFAAAKDNHQYKNALPFFKEGKIWLKEQKHLTTDKFKKLLEDLILYPNFLNIAQNQYEDYSNFSKNFCLITETYFLNGRDSGP